MPGGGNPDYSVLATWEAASDNDLTGTGVVALDCYDSQYHDDNVTFSGATGLSATVYREIRSALDCAVPWAGQKDTGANFVSATKTTGITLSESYARAKNLYCELSTSASSNIYIFQSQAASCLGRKFINCVAKANRSGSGWARGFLFGDIASGVQSSLAFNCISLDCMYGFVSSAWETNTINAFVCCTASNDLQGFNSYSSNWSKSYVFSCYAVDCQNGCYNGSDWDSPSGWNASDDNTASTVNGTGDNYKNGLDLVGTGKMSSVGLALSNDLYANGSAGDRYGRNPYNDLSATVDFDDFLKNDASGESISKKDIRGINRQTPDTADASWNVGASEIIPTITETTDLDSVFYESNKPVIFYPGVGTVATEIIKFMVPGFGFVNLNQFSIEGSICWAEHPYGEVSENSIRPLSADWSGTGSIVIDSDGYESMIIDSGQYMECKPVYTDVTVVKLEKEKYI